MSRQEKVSSPLKALFQYSVVCYLYFKSASANSSLATTSPLDIAVFKDDLRLVTFLLNKGADPVQFGRNVWGIGSGLSRVPDSSSKFVQSDSQRPCNNWRQFSTDYDKPSPLNIAVLKDDLRLVAFLLSKRDLVQGMADYKDFVILAEAKAETDCYKDAEAEVCIHNTLWKVHYDEVMGNWESTKEYFTAQLEDILPRKETCHAEILFIHHKNSITHKFYDKFEMGDRKRDTKHKYQERRKDYTHRAAVIRILEEKQKFVKEFDNRWAKDVIVVVNGEKCAGDRQYLSAISPVFKKMLQDHAQDEITLEGVESADVLKDFFLAISSFCVQPNPTNVVPLLKLAQDYGIPFLMRSCEEHLKHCYEIPTKYRYNLAMKYNLNGLHEDMIKNLKHEKMMREEMVTELEEDVNKGYSYKKDKKELMTAIGTGNEISLLLKMAEESFIDKKQNIEAEFLKENILKEFENRWAKDVTFVVNGEKCAGDRQYLSAISPVFKQIMGLRWRKQDKKMLQDHAQDEITLEGVESADVLKDFFLAISPLRVQPNPTNVVPLLKLADYYDIPFLMRNCEELLKQCSEIPAIDRFLLAMKYELDSLRLSTEKSLNSDDLIKILDELNVLEQKRKVLERLSNKDLAEILKKKKDILSEIGAEFLLENIAERLENSYCRKRHALEFILDNYSESDHESESGQD